MATPPAPTYTYSGDPSTSARDELRFLIQDTDPAMGLLADNELDYLINTWMPKYDSLTFVASIASAVISRKFAGITTVSADGVEVDISALSKTYAQMAVNFREEYNEAQDSGADVDLSNIEWEQAFDPSIAPLNFGIGMNDNPEAGQQAYSGAQPPGGVPWNWGWLDG